MTLICNNRLGDGKLEIKTHPHDIDPEQWVYLHCDQRMNAFSLSDFFEFVNYVLTNTDLTPNDQRIAFLKQKFIEVPGLRPGNRKLKLEPESPKD